LLTFLPRAKTPEQLIVSCGQYLEENFSDLNFIIAKYAGLPAHFINLNATKQSDNIFKKITKSNLLLNHEPGPISTENFTVFPVFSCDRYLKYFFAFENLSPGNLSRIESVMQEFQSLYNLVTCLLHEQNHHLQIEHANLVSQIGHDINGLISLLNTESDSKAIRDKCSYLERLITDLLTYTRELQLIKSKINLTDLIFGVLKLHNWKEKVYFSPSKLPSVLNCDIELISTALAAVLSNAIRANEGIGEKVQIKHEIIPAFSFFVKGTWIKISIMDGGKGMPRDFYRQAFDPFFTLHKNDGHTGFGLSNAQKIFSAHGGQLNLFPRDPAGITAEIILPTEDAK